MSKEIALQDVLLLIIRIPYHFIYWAPKNPVIENALQKEKEGGGYQRSYKEAQI